jgi:ABC-type spermidine/putrescine transport system permease subunit I
MKPRLSQLSFGFLPWLLVLTSLAFGALPFVLWLVTIASSFLRPGLFNGVFSLYLSLLPRTLWLSAAAALFATISGSAVAFVAVSGSRKQRDFLTVIMTLPLLMGFIARNYAWVGILSELVGETRILFLSTIARALLYRPAGIVVVMTTVFIPICYFVELRGLDGLSKEALQAARTLGATDAVIFWRLVLPVTRNTHLAAFILALSLAVGYFITPQLIGGGNYPFVGNGVIMFFDLGRPADASLLALLLGVTVVVVLACITALFRLSAWCIRRLRHTERWTARHRSLPFPKIDIGSSE